MLRWHGQQLGTEFSKKCPTVRNSRTISTEWFAPSGSISYIFARRFKSTFWFCSLQSFWACTHHELAMLLCSTSRCQSGSAKFAWCAWLLAKVSLSRKPYSYTFTNFTIHHFAYYLVLEKNKGRWTIHCLSEHYEIFNFQYWMLPRNLHLPINPFAILPLWLLGIYIRKNLFAFTFANKNRFVFTEIFSQ